MGAVYLAREASLDRLVAIKVLHPDRTLAAQAQERFRREARTAARLTHPNIVPLHGIGEIGDQPYFVMGYVAGESLGSRLRREGRLGVEPSLRILSEVADALDYAHRQGVVHRDVKPENVLLEAETGRALLSDFGLAKAAGAESTMSSGHVLGTPHYMSPEQAAGGTADQRSDVYSLGVMAYRMLGGRLPFQSDDLQELLVKHIRETPPPLDELASDLPGPLVAAVQRCMAKNPVQRWPDMRAARRALTGEAGDAGIVTRLAGQGPLIALWTAGAAALLMLPVAFATMGPSVLRDVTWVAEGLVWTFILLLLVAYGSKVIRTLERSRTVGFTWREIFATLFRQPRWWTGPYPRRLRWPGDLWDRLPRAVRVVRTMAQIPLLFLLLGVPLTVVASRPGGPEDAAFITGLITLFGFLGGLFVSGVLATLLPRGQSELCWLPTMDAEAWRDPQVVRRLRPAGGDLSAETTAPGQHAEAMARLADEMWGPARPMAEEAAFAGRRVAAALAELEHEALEMTRHADRDEMERLRHRLSVLGPAAPAEPPETAELRRLLVRQLELLAPMEDRVLALQATRQRLRELLLMMHRELALVRQALDESAEAWRAPAARLQDLWREAVAITDTAPTTDATAATRTR